jgi:hypothetical protein
MQEVCFIGRTYRRSTVALRATISRHRGCLGLLVFTVVGRINGAHEELNELFDGQSGYH